MGKIASANTGAGLSVGEVARRSGVAVSAIHFYEQKGLIKSWRKAGNQRCFQREVLRRIAVIKVAQRVGVPLGEIGRTLSALPKRRALTAEDWRQLSAQWRGDLNRRIEVLTRLRDQPITGPYLDKNGRDMRNGGGSLRRRQ